MKGEFARPYFWQGEYEGSFESQYMDKAAYHEYIIAQARQEQAQVAIDALIEMGGEFVSNYFMHFLDFMNRAKMRVGNSFESILLCDRKIYKNLKLSLFQTTKSEVI